MDTTELVTDSVGIAECTRDGGAVLGIGDKN